MNKTEDPDFVASWQKVEEALKRLDENQVERLFSMKHASLADFHQALTKELELKAAALGICCGFFEGREQGNNAGNLRNKVRNKETS